MFSHTFRVVLSNHLARASQSFIYLRPKKLRS